MANFVPLKNHMFYYLDRVIAEHRLAPPFLDVGCGLGDLSVFLAQKGWPGKAIDSSEVAIERSRHNLASFAGVEVSKSSLSAESGAFQTVFLWDVLEHIEDDETALKKVSSLLSPGGHLLMFVPSNAREWRWDDSFYGHYRRYDTAEMRDKLIKAGLEPRVFYDITFPVFWAMRRLYTYLKSSPKDKMGELTREDRTSLSSTINSWDIPFLSSLLDQDNFFWRALSRVQYRFFKDSLSRGHEMLVLAQKPVRSLN